MYSVIVVVYDKAGNFKSTRCLIFYDNQSKVDAKPNKRTIVTQTSKETNYTWVSVTEKTLNVAWEDLFINERHKNHSWLSVVASLPKVDNVYDDHFGKRDVMAIPNAHGKTQKEVFLNPFLYNCSYDEILFYESLVYLPVFICLSVNPVFDLRGYHTL